MKRLFPLSLPILTVLLFSATAGETLLEDAFDRSELGRGWTIQNGSWQIENGILRASETPADKHSASARRILTTTDASYRLRFRLVETGRGFHLGFDPARGELNKKGHLYSVMVTPSQWRLMKHVDKNRPKDDPNEVLAQEHTEFAPGTWYELRVIHRGTEVTASIDGKGTLKGSHPTFDVKKPTLVFRCLGDGVEIDDLQVTALN